jgi:hypothetical protein
VTARLEARENYGGVDLISVGPAYTSLTRFGQRYSVMTIIPERGGQDFVGHDVILVQRKSFRERAGDGHRFAIGSCKFDIQIAAQIGSRKCLNCTEVNGRGWPVGRLLPRDRDLPDHPA